MIEHDCGDRALLVEFENLAETMTWHRALAASAIDDVEDLVPAARTILVRHTGNRDRVVSWVRSTEPADVDATSDAEPVVVPVTYDGEDLGDVADAMGMSAQEVISAHTEQTWTVAFGGFAPGFGYLVGTTDRLHVPRRTTPRTTVPAGAVGLAGEFSGIYPRSSPGGWQLIGRTDAVLWDPQREPPALLCPGVTVRFEAR
ncbi:allophanate hydrolase subunit 1 [Rhodococcus sp. BP-252]|uniref:5-oxoprolinase subunit B family protein n=1 Tax=unclassified Rhodococcus (in: high G+C Gram-positive bacteria) TaxID=192944 RepID=UPI001C9AB86C|nr:MULTISPECIES: allophanate hydrolase subunit 1 [unclassified Rhodococcus (in: high G+C Gram-positive bacteria)]MBY6413220.1 allophanate hydrolase subunit 1 [Rhodococcus sp. BP-320]MBY6418699.1 allophanate hydrolase subunit 1 [Rhodococcus sp. BP-321]MBY6422993.1 allophanate hydrolase subunit 1 [Rhodococcus sp. BP-324]MBY6427963.1 allophanate hydrolase subunit 1 [Rhodococcus sp. BP-323]MBY6433141.1 allophanate hydrolase subunit 1 [Rhodococcus sp. BP-322]